MRILMIVATVFFVTTGAFAQAHDRVSTDDKVKAEIQKLFADLNAAITKKDRAHVGTTLCKRVSVCATGRRNGHKGSAY